MFEIVYFMTGNGHKPVEEFIDSLDTKMQVKVMRQLKLLKEYGPRLGEPFSRRLAQGVYELRVQQSNNITRILLFYVINRKIILTHGFVKKTQRTPQGEIARALQYKEEYESR